MVRHVLAGGVELSYLAGEGAIDLAERGRRSRRVDARMQEDGAADLEHRLALPQPAPIFSVRPHRRLILDVSVRVGREPLVAVFFPVGLGPRSERPLTRV